MKNFIIIVLIGSCIAVFGLGMTACKSKGSSTKLEKNGVLESANNSKNSLDWAGFYTGTVPCADCEGISTQITLKNDNTYSMQTEYVGKGGSAENYAGTFQWNNAGNIVILSGLKEKSMPDSYLVGENKLIQLDMEGNVITGSLASNYVLNKVDRNLVDKKWVLVGIEGVALSTPPAVEAFITFNSKDNRVFGNSGCNNFSGSYKLGPGKQLMFSSMVTTRKMCVDMSIEDEINRLFDAIDSYTLQNDTLNLAKGGVSLIRLVVK